MEYAGLSLKKHYNSWMYTSPGREAPKTEKNHTPSNPIFNYISDKLDCRDGESDAGR